MPLAATVRRLVPIGALAALLMLAGAPAAHAVDTGGTGAGTTPPVSIPAPSTTTDPFVGNAVWIWNIARSAKGDPVAIGARAKAAGLSYVVVKAANGTTAWPGFTAPFIAALHAQGLRVCGYQRVQSSAPVRQARLFAAQIKLGADCAVIDAESELEGRYTEAAQYMKTLRIALGSRFPIALTSFPWIGYHPQFPYSVFLGKGGAQFNLPQIYWKAIGVSVSKAFNNTYPANSVFNRPIRPLGQVYGSPSSQDILSFRTLSAQYGATGVSWWVWESATNAAWSAIGVPIVVPALAHLITPPTLSVGASGDLVRWARIRLAARHAVIATNADRFNAAMRTTVLAFQSAHGLPQTGSVDPATWAVLKPHYKLAAGY